MITAVQTWERIAVGLVLLAGAGCLILYVTLCIKGPRR